MPRPKNALAGVILNWRSGGRRFPTIRYLADIIQRDERDSGRALSPLRPADDAIIVDTSDMTPDQVVEQILRLATEEPVIMTSAI